MEEIKSLLADINEKLSDFNKLYPRPDWSKKTKEELLLNFTFHSNKIEGLHFSYGETISFLKSGMLENKSMSQPEIMADISMLQNHQKALSFIFEQYEKRELSTAFILNVHEAIMATGTFLDDISGPGTYRGDDICVRKSNGEMKYFLIDTKIPEAMEELVNSTNRRMKMVDFESVENHPLVTAIDLHVDFLNIHPFRDGNGRTARLLMNMVNMKFKIPPFSPKSDKENRVQYYEAFNQVDIVQNNYPMVVFLANQLLEVLDSAILKAKEQGFDKN